MAADDHEVDVAGRTLRLTHLDKVLYPATGTTKGEVIDYLTAIAPVMLPHLAGRPVTRKRWPEGLDGPVFFAKAIEPGAPAWIPRRRIEHRTGPKDYPLIEEAAALVYFAQLASLELHTPQWRFAPDGTAGHPDRIVFDLDPGPGAGLAECARVAERVRERLREHGFTLFPVTSGSKGIHLYAPDTTRTSDEAAEFARTLARSLESEHPELITSVLTRDARAGRVLIDWSQNRGAKTTVAPYSLRGREHPTVAAPRTWAEVAEPGLRQLTFSEVRERVRAQGDLLSGLEPESASGGAA